MVTLESNVELYYKSPSPALWNSYSKCNHSKDTILQLALINRTSGSQQGKELIGWLQQLLGEERVFSISSEQQVRHVLEMNVCCSQWKILVCGGDGTCNLVVQVLQVCPLQVCMIHIPIGTGNELARSLGWGGSCRSFMKLQQLVNYVELANREAMDVWNINVQTSHEESKKFRKPTCMIGFLSLGIDAQVELCFNESRWKNPSGYQYTWLNIAKYGWYGLQTMWKWTQVAGIHEFVDSFEMDNYPLDIPADIQSIILLNLPSYGAGAFPIKQSSNSPNQWKIFGNDRVLEVVGITSLFHFLSLELGMSARKLGQGRSIFIRLKQSKLPLSVQVDGEPWSLRSGTIQITSSDKRQCFALGPSYQKHSSHFVQFAE
ncbi:diacylglycerol kinase [Galdieria sulphuraria]|uniref:Diacylglycerol kinase n=1 Tax=Galdieria sulphuraria TaxID=130081 RepID=M2WRS5_GALSU|nr:diacylglycerol kinase [Galdieria sulphuraria]EME26535.1 diacylglycerol kinase [Galdieria sulphuraria]|eukprot:XP_005703055.1 diacylglycerol kinase [Galdieria sulphuraria]